MVMDFWEAQRRARTRTMWCALVFVLLTLVVACLAEVAMRYFAQPNYNPPLPYVGMAFLAITFCVALFQYAMFSSSGGAYVAESIGAQLLNKDNASTSKEQQLLNIVEEMAVAASLPTPAVYLINAHEINAFAAGMKADNAVIAVTRGSLAVLSRDELQGVVAHEFGHIRNGDMLISMRLAAMIMGFFFVLYLGLRLFEISSIRGSRDDDRRGGNPLAIAALILLVAGAFTWLAGSLLKCMVSRQREYLADAMAVQFTRNPNGIADALRKISKEQVSDMPKSGTAYSHMYFEDRSLLSSLFASHPPVEKRIAAIEGRTYSADVAE